MEFTQHQIDQINDIPDKLAAYHRFLWINATEWIEVEAQANAHGMLANYQLLGQNNRAGYYIVDGDLWKIEFDSDKPNGGIAYRSESGELRQAVQEKFSGRGW